MAELAELGTEQWKRARTRDVRRWGLSQGRPLEPGAIELIVDVKQHCLAEPVDRWTLDGLADLMWTYVPQWCASSEADRPKHLAETLWIYLAYLSDTAQLVPGSDDLAALQSSLVAYGGLDRFGRSRARVRGRRKASPLPSPKSGDSGVAPIIPLRPRPVGGWSPLAAT